MFTLPITHTQLEKAQVLADELGTLPNSITNGEGNIIGCIGEVVVSQYFGVPLENTYDYDFVWKGYRMDVKSKRTSVFPQPHYQCDISTVNNHQECDAYVFARIDMSKDILYLLGYLPKDDFYNRASYVPKGSVCSTNGLIFKHNNYSVSISELLPLPEI